MRFDCMWSASTNLCDKRPLSEVCRGSEPLADLCQICLVFRPKEVGFIFDGDFFALTTGLSSKKAAFWGVAYPLLNSHQDYLPMDTEQNATICGPARTICGIHTLRTLAIAAGKCHATGEAAVFQTFKSPVPKMNKRNISLL